MGTEVLYPQNILGERFRVCQPVFHRRKSPFVNGNGFGNVKSNNYGYRKQLNHRPERLDTKRKSTTVQQSTDQQLNTTPRRTVVDLEDHYLNRSSNLQHQQQQQLQKGLEMGQVTVLRRGHSLDSLETKRNKNSNVKAKGGILIKNKFNINGGYGDSLYAGSTFLASPAPESLPLPTFFYNKKNGKKEKYDASASRDLRRLLRLE